MNSILSALVIASLLLQTAIQSGGGGTQRLASAPGGGTPTLVQECDYYVNYGAGPAACTLSGVGAGDAIVIGVESGVAITSTTANGTSQTAVDTVSDSGNYALDYVLGNATGGTVAISVAMGSTGRTRIIAAEFSGVATSPLSNHDTEHCLSGCTNTYLDSASFTQSANDVVWSMCTDYYGNSITTGTLPTAATQISTISWSSTSYLAEYFLVPTAGSTYGSCTTSAYSAMHILTMTLKHA